MALLDHIATCNEHDLSEYTPFRIGERQVGWVDPAVAEKLGRWGHYFKVTEREVAMLESLKSVEERTRAMSEVCAALVVQDVLPHSRAEMCPVTTGFGAPVLMHLDRAWLAPFGVISYGVHLNGIVDRPNGPEMWIGVRAKDRTVAPGKLDNIVAGGLPAGLSLKENLVKEAAEEASIPEDVARTARPVGAVSYVMDTKAGLRRDMLFVYDIELSPRFEPQNADGEISGFVRWPLRQVMRVVEETDEFKFNVNLVLIDFAIRHGLIGPDRKDYMRLLRGLRAWG